jgi:hypothetical protein
MTSSRVEIRSGLLDAADDRECFVLSADGQRTTHFVLGLFPSFEIAERGGSGCEDGA